MQPLPAPVHLPAPQPRKTVAEQVAEKLGITLKQLQDGIEGAEEEPSTRAKEAVPDSPELQRILALPRRVLGNGEQESREITDAFRTPWGTETARPIQGLAFREMFECRGGFFPIVPGGGKTWIGYMAAMAFGARRPAYICPAPNMPDARKEFRRLSYHWKGPHPDTIKIFSYSKVGHKNSGNVLCASTGKVLSPGFLEREQIDLLILDEADALKDKGTAVTKRFAQFIAANPRVPVVAMTGTFADSSIQDWAHIARWCLPVGCPVPVRWTDLKDWCAALDHNVQERSAPGALVKLCNPEELALIQQGLELEAVQTAFSRRVLETPGVVATREAEFKDVRLVIDHHWAGDENELLEEYFTKLRVDYETPDGIPFADPKDEWRHARELGIGFHYKWREQPPPEWKLARKAEAAWCRQALKYNKRGLHSVATVRDAVRAGIYNDGGLLAAWEAIEPTFVPHTEAVWHDSEALDFAADWAKQVGGVVWVEHTEFGNELARRTGMSYFGKKGLDQHKRHITQEDGTRPIIASIKSNGRGRNLQAWDRGLMMGLPQSARQCEQLLARHHRPGQKSDTVQLTVYMGCYEHINGYRVAQDRARYQERQFKNAQRLLYAEDRVPSWLPGTGKRWAP